MTATANLLIGRRSVIETGNSQGVTIPADVLADMDVEIGDDVTLLYDRETKRVTVEQPSESSEGL